MRTRWRHPERLRGGGPLACLLALTVATAAHVQPAVAATVLPAQRSVEPCPLDGDGAGDKRTVFCDEDRASKPRKRSGKDGSPAKPRVPKPKTAPRKSDTPRIDGAPDGGAVPALQPTAELSDGNPDPFRALGAGSPFCKRAAIASRPSCRMSGSVAHIYPASNYGIDVQVETGVTKVEGNLFAALQSVAAMLWLGLVYALKGVLLLLEWAFSLDLLNEAMRGVRRALERLHERVLGQAWFLAAISVAGLWAIWRGLVQGRAVQTLAGLASTVGLMVVALVLIANPTGTVGHASKLANEGSLGLLSAASSGSTSSPERSFARSSERLFDALVLSPWCALQFGDVRWCTARRKGGLRNADVWLAFPADGKEREAIYKLTKGEEVGGGGLLSDVGDILGDVATWGPTAGPLAGGLGIARGKLADEEGVAEALKQRVRKEPGKVRMQEKDGTFTRLALMAMVAVGLTGAIALLLWLAIKLVLAGLMSLILLLLAPAMLFAPAFGESGRATFVGWIKRLVGALAAKLIYALLLAVVIVAATSLAALDIGWFGTWLLQIAFWWGILIKRKELTGFLTVSQDEDRDHGLGAFRLYANARAAKAVGEGAAGVALALPRRGRRVAALRTLQSQEAGAAATTAAATRELDTHADRARGLELDEARRTLALRPGLEAQGRTVSRALRPYEDESLERRANGGRPRDPRPDERALFAERERVERLLGSDDMRRADSVVREADRALAREGRVTSDAERAAWREQRRRDLQEGLAPDHDRNLRAAGVDPREFRACPEAEREQLRARSAEAIERDKRLLAAVPERGQRESATPQQVSEAKLAIPPEELRRRTAERRAAWQHERGQRKRRQHLYRR